MAKVTQVFLQDCTKLPIKTIQIADKMLPNVIVSTPHRGDVEINIKKKHYPFLFGSATETDRSATEVMRDLWKLEEDSKDYLLNNWIETLTK